MTVQNFAPEAAMTPTSEDVVEASVSDSEEEFAL